MHRPGHRSNNREHAPRFTFLCIYSFTFGSNHTELSGARLQHSRSNSNKQHSKHERGMSDGVSFASHSFRKSKQAFRIIRLADCISYPPYTVATYSGIFLNAFLFRCIYVYTYKPARQLAQSVGPVSQFNLGC